MRTMVSMELDDEEKIDYAPVAASVARPDYPYGLRISLTEKEFAKLGIDPSDCKVGEIFHLRAMARVKAVSADENEGGSCCRVEAQIEDLGLESEDDES
jgi:hypothetical protein